MTGETIVIVTLPSRFRVLRTTEINRQPTTLSETIGHLLTGSEFTGFPSMGIEGDTRAWTTEPGGGFVCRDCLEEIA